MKLKLFVLLVLGIIGIIFSSGCIQQKSPEGTIQPTGITSAKAWMDIELKDVTTGNKFKLSDFKGKPILLESFAVWCPTCLEQQKKISELKSNEGDAIVHISLDTDPNEDEAKVKEHVKRYGFDWYFAVSPIELTNALRDEFGLGIVNAPAAPVVLICQNQSARFLRRGVKPPDELLSEIKSC